MKGHVKAYSAAVNAGIIEGSDGVRYQFAKAEWNGTMHPASNDAEVSFNPEGKRATHVTDGKPEKPGKKK